MAFFPDVEKIRFEGPDSKNPLGFRHYNADEKVEGKSMKDHLRFAVCYWHTFRGMGGDPFGPGCHRRPWEDGTDSVDMAVKRVQVAFEFMEKLGVPFYLLPRPRRRSGRQEPARDQRQPRQGRQGAQGRACSGPASSCSGARPTCSATPASSTGPPPAATPTSSPTPRPRSRSAWKSPRTWAARTTSSGAAARATRNLYNTDMKRELDHLAKFFHLAVEYKKKIGFTGQFLIEPKPKEPTVHQYDFDAAAVRRLPARLRPGRSLQAQRRDQPRHAGRPHDDARTDLRLAATACSARSTPTAAICCSAGTPISSRPIYYLTTQCMLVILGQGGLAPGGVNFDAKVRRESFEPVDLFHAHIGGMDAFARRPEDRRPDPQGRRAEGFRQAALRLVGQRASARRSRAGKAKFEDLEKYMLEKGDVTPNVSGRQEMLENIINRYL